MPPSRREELVEAAVRVFGRNGFHASGIDAVLAEAGVSRMTLYNHFKSKDELIVAALRRRDEITRNRLMRSVEEASPDARGRLLAFFDYHAGWFEDADFEGCLFSNAAAEFHDADSAARRAVAENKREVVRYLTRLAEQAGASEPAELAESLNLVLQGAVTMAYTVGRLPDGDVSAVGRRARETAELLVDRAIAA